MIEHEEPEMLDLVYLKEFIEFIQNRNLKVYGTIADFNYNKIKDFFHLLDYIKFDNGYIRIKSKFNNLIIEKCIGLLNSIYVQHDCLLIKFVEKNMLHPFKQNISVIVIPNYTVMNRVFTLSKVLDI